MNLVATRRMLEVCLWSDVVPAMQGDRGIGKTQVVEQISNTWIDPYTGKTGIHTIVLHLATQEITDLIGFPIKVWEKSSIPVVESVESTISGDRIVTSWAAPIWWPNADSVEDAADKVIYDKMVEDGASETELWLFWNRPKFILFLDEAKRASREVMQAMYPLVLNKQLHTKTLPRGARIITADNYAGSYDVREPDEAFTSRFCHIDVEPDVPGWLTWAAEHGVHKKVKSFLASMPALLLEVPPDHKDAQVKTKPLPDPRSWDMVSRVEKYGHIGIQRLATNVIQGVKNQVIAGIIGIAAATQYAAFAEATITFEDMLQGKASIKAALDACGTDETERNKVSEKMVVETSSAMKDRPYNATEGKNLKKFIVELEQQDRAVAILQTIFMLKNNSKLEQAWITMLTDGKEIEKEIAYLLAKHNV